MLQQLVLARPVVVLVFENLAAEILAEIGRQATAPQSTDR
jgi:hypothetical protein